MREEEVQLPTFRDLVNGNWKAGYLHDMAANNRILSFYLGRKGS